MNFLRFFRALKSQRIHDELDLGARSPLLVFFYLV